MTSTNSILDMLKQKAKAQLTDNASYDLVIGDDADINTLAYSGFIDTTIERIKKRRPDIKEFFTSWGCIQLIPFYCFYPSDGQYKLGTNDLALLADKIHINVIMPSYVLSSSDTDISYDKILHISQLKSLRLEIKVGSQSPSKVYVMKLNHNNAYRLADMLLDQIIDKEFPYPNDTFFKAFDFYSSIKQIASRAFDTHIIRLDSGSWQFKAYPTARVIQKTLTIDFLGSDSPSFNRISVSKAIVEHEPVLYNPRSRVLAEKASANQRLPYIPASITKIIQIIQDEFLDISPILDDSADLIYIENLIIEKSQADSSKASMLDNKIRARMRECLFFTADEI